MEHWVIILYINTKQIKINFHYRYGSRTVAPNTASKKSNSPNPSTRPSFLRVTT